MNWKQLRKVNCALMVVLIVIFIGIALTIAEKVGAQVNENSKWVVVENSGQCPTSTCTLQVGYNPTNLAAGIVATATWTTTNPEGWHDLDWDEGDQHFGWKGLSGTITKTHVYALWGTYTVTFTTDAVDPDEDPCSTSVVITFTEPIPTPTPTLTPIPTETATPTPTITPTPEPIDFLVWLPLVAKTLPQPHGTLNLRVSDPAVREVHASGTYENATEWGACISDWGHTGSGNKPVCFQEFEGEFDVLHQFPTGGTFTVTLTVNGVLGTDPFITTSVVTVP